MARVRQKPMSHSLRFAAGREHERIAIEAVRGGVELRERDRQGVGRRGRFGSEGSVFHLVLGGLDRPSSGEDIEPAARGSRLGRLSEPLRRLAQGQPAREQRGSATIFFLSLLGVAEQYETEPRHET